MTEPEPMSEVRAEAEALYEENRDLIETRENLGRLFVLDLDSGNFVVDDLGLDAAATLKSQNPNAQLFAMRVGYRSAASFSGELEPRQKRNGALEGEDGEL